MSVLHVRPGAASDMGLVLLANEQKRGSGWLLSGVLRATLPA